MTEKHGQSQIEKSTKNVSSNRLIPIPTIIVELLNKLYLKESNVYGFTNDYYVFGGAEPLADTTIARRNTNIAQRAGLFEISPHEFRHSYTTLAKKSVGGVMAVSKLLGHSDLKTTEIYTHIDESEKSAVIEYINSVTKT